MVQSPLLSICIPTYNRAKNLDKTLEIITKDYYYNEKIIEIVVSDNCSSDNTQEVVSKYKSVKYYRIDNIISAGENVIKVLEYGTGTYLKLYNDTVLLKKNTLKCILDEIKNSTEQTNLFFVNNNFLNANITKEIAGSDSFLYELSFNTTWILNFGIWKNELKKIQNKYEFAALQFPHVDIAFKLLENNSKVKLFFYDFVDVQELKKKGGYNIFNTFANNYLLLLQSKRISYLSYKIEKYRLFRYFIYPWCCRLFINKHVEFDFSTENAFLIILKKYFYEVYFYPIFFVFIFKKMKSFLFSPFSDFDHNGSK